MKVGIGIALMAIMVPSANHAEVYKVSLTRKDSNLYQVDMGKLFLRTRYCYEFAMAQDAVVDTDRMQVVFLGGIGSTKCDIEMLLQQVG